MVSYTLEFREECSYSKWKQHSDRSHSETAGRKRGGKPGRRTLRLTLSVSRVPSLSLPWQNWDRKWEMWQAMADVCRREDFSRLLAMCCWPEIVKIDSYFTLVCKGRVYQYHSRSRWRALIDREEWMGKWKNTWGYSLIVTVPESQCSPAREVGWLL